MDSNPQPLTTKTGITTKKPKRRRKLLFIVGAILAAITIVLIGLSWWWNSQLAPVDVKNTAKVLVNIDYGTTPDEIASKLRQEKLINNEFVFNLYTRQQGVRNQLQAGTYRLSPSNSTPEIVAHLVQGKSDTFDITFIPGATLADNRKVLIDSGFSVKEVDEALNASYDSPLFAGKPSQADLEGYIYGETYNFAVNTSVKSVLEHIFEHFYGIVEEERLVELYQAQGLNLYQGITLASIIQRESGSVKSDMPTIAQVFFSRLAIGMPLGSDVTYQYIADKTGVPRSINLDSPYNTRIYTGLPPGPISTAGVEALRAVGAPSSTDYMYFLSGDDNITYFSRTFAEHEAAIAAHCQIKCQAL